MSISDYKKYIKDLFILAIPLFFGALGHTLLGTTDVLVVARYSIKSLSAVSIGNSIIFTILIFGIGLLVAISIILANMQGAKQHTKKYLSSTLLLSLFLGLVFFCLCYCSKFFIPHIGLEQALVPYIQEYISIVSISMIGVFIFEGIKQFLQAYEIVKFPNVILLIAAVLNLILDIIFVFGVGFIPEMGVRGAALATLTVRTIMGITMILYVARSINFKVPIDFLYMKNVLKTGLPIGIALLLEFLAFNIITVLAGIEKSILAAVHSILTTISSLTFMIPVAISTALSVKVAYYYGAKKEDEVRKYSFTAICMVLFFMVLIGAVLALYPDEIISLFTAEKAVLDIAVPLISILAAYQIFDGLQAAVGGILKGFKKTKTVSLTVLAGYWLIGAPIAVMLVYFMDMSLKGYWMALAVSLCAIGLMQSVIAKYYYKKLFNN